MSAKAKSFALLCLAALVAGAGAVLALVFLVLPRERMKAAEALAKAAAEKASSLKAAAAVVEKHAEVRVAQVEKRVEAEKAQDSVDLANDIIAGRKDKA